MVMNTQTYSALLTQPELLKNEHISELKSIIKEYPYFQSARALYLKGLKNQNSFRYNNELKLTAAYTTDRSVLFDFITSEKFEETQEDIHQQILQKISEETPSEIVENVEVAEAKLDLGKPIQFSPRETHSFNEWLQLSTQKTIIREEKKSLDKFGIIDRFIENNPKIIPVNKDEKIHVDIPKNKVDKSLMTETLAKVYLEQKKYSKAIKAYEILSLKYPEKSGFFADQIKRVKILQKNKS
jgi:tetratricopeptide (TPR) repeat protein